jgi:hypothetical protein
MYYHINLLLHVSVLLMRHPRGFQYKPAELLLIVMKAEQDDPTHQTDSYNIQPSSCSAFMTLENNSAGSY